MSDKNKSYNMIETIKRLLPDILFNIIQSIYHLSFSILGAMYYNFPAKKLTVILVTGTKGKTTTTQLIYEFLKESGYRTSLVNGINFCIRDKVIRNETRMSVPGKFFLQRFFRESLDAQCTHAVVEMTSQGAQFHRHLFTYPNALVVTNIAREHIESHGSFENYVEAKLKIKEILDKSPKNNKTLVLNGDDSIITTCFNQVGDLSILIDYFTPSSSSIKVSDDKTTFTYKNEIYKTYLLGRGSAENILASMTVSTRYGVRIQDIEKVLGRLKYIEGRMQKIKTPYGFDVVIDYAHTKESFEQFFELFKGRPAVCVLASAGGGRDKEKRYHLGKIASDRCKHIILTEEDSYDEDPKDIAKDIEKGIEKDIPREFIRDRKKALEKAIKKAYSMRNKKPIVLIPGVGSDRWIMTKKNGATKWDEEKIINEAIKKI